MKGGIQHQTQWQLPAREIHMSSVWTCLSANSSYMLVLGQVLVTYARVRIWRRLGSLSSGNRASNVWHQPFTSMSNRNSNLPHKTIVLVGLMGSGKTAVGKRLAARIGRVFVDSDEEVEKNVGCSIDDIFSRDGEEAFRKGEQRVITNLLDNPPLILATGGGAFLDPHTRKYVSSKAISVWLHADLSALLKRVGVGNDRPLLRHGEPREVMQRLMQERYPIYAEADLTVKTSNRSQRWVVDKICQMLAEQRQVLAKGQI